MINNLYIGAMDFILKQLNSHTTIEYFEPSKFIYRCDEFAFYLLGVENLLELYIRDQ